MILSDLTQWKSLSELKGLEPAFRFLEENDLAQLPAGRQPIDGDAVFAIVQKARSKPASQGRFESHRKYVDVQYLVSGREMIGVAPVQGLRINEAYDEGTDLAFYESPADYRKLEMKPGRFAVFFPDDGHMPNCEWDGPAEFVKVVVKVSVDLVAGKA
jgi:YhcH/YjgK/YiaL family protein